MDINWTEDEDKLLQEFALNGKTMQDVADALPGRSRSAVSGRADRLGIKFNGKRKKGKFNGFWSDSDIKFLKDNYERLTAKKISEDLGKSVCAVENKSTELRLKKRTRNIYD